MERSPSTPLTYRRQFLVSTNAEDLLPAWASVTVGGNFHVGAHPELQLTQVEEAGTSVTLLGFFLDPDHPAAGDEEILRRLVKCAATPDEIVRATDSLGGRWVLIVHPSGGETFVLQDATGQRQVYYVRDPEVNGVVCASEVAVMIERSGDAMDPAAVDFIRSRGKPDDYEIYWMPGDTSLVSGIAALLPNHVLTLPTRVTRRVSPLPVISEMTRHEAIAECVRLLHGQMDSARLRFPLAIPMTAGWDSRLILALNREHAENLYAFTLAYPHLPVGSVDVEVPARLLAKLGIDHQVIPYPAGIDASYKKTFRRSHVAANDAYCGDIQALRDHYPADRVCVTGDAAEIVKGYYRKTRPSGKPVSAAELAESSRLGNHPFVTAAFERWLADARDTSLDVLDLFCWEQMAGRWQAKIRSEYDMVQESFTPLNNRRLLAVMLGTDPALRRAPDFVLFTELMQSLWPEVLSEPINPPERPSRKRQVLDVIKKTGVLTLIPATTKEKVKGMLR